MNKPVNIKNKKIVSYSIEKNTKPQYVYIPLESKSGEEYKSLVKDGDYVYKGDAVAIDEKLNFPIHSSVSGYVITESTKIINNGKKVKCITIENDYKEKYAKNSHDKDDLSSYTKEKFIDDLRKCGIVGLGGSGFPTFIKYDTPKVKYILINAVECEPFVSCDKALVHNYSDFLLEGIDAIIEIMKIPKAIIAIKETDTDIINAIRKYLGTYPNIKLKLVKDAYPNGWERLLVKNTLHIEYDKYPTEKGIIVSNISTIYSIYEMLKYHRPLTERIITITGHGMKKESNVKVKIGSLASEVISNLEGYKDIKNPLFVAGGPMMGNSLPTDDLVITKDLNCILVIEDNFEKNLPCIKCGKCVEVCPAGISPVLIMNNYNNLGNLKYLKPDECIECGLCSFTCPSKIEVREFVRIAKEKVNK